MAAQRYYGDDATLLLEDDAATPAEIPVASLKGLTITLSAEHTKLYSGDSIIAEAEKKSQAEFPIEISVAAFDVALMQAWLSGDSTTPSTTGLTDTSDVAEFRVKGDMTSVDGATTTSVQVTGVTFPDLPALDMSEGEYIVHDISGSGKNITDLS